MIRTSFRLGLAGFVLSLSGFCTAALAGDCESLLVPDFTLPWLDTTTDLAYLSIIDAGNFPRHRTNALPKLSHAGVALPIASDLLLHAQSFDDFAAARAKRYAEHRFDYAPEDLAAYYRRLLPKPRFDSYAACTGASGFAARVTKANHDLAVIEFDWRAPKDGPARAAVAKFTVSGGTLLGQAPVSLPATLMLERKLDADLHVSATMNGKAETVFVPRYVSETPRREAGSGRCTSAARVVGALYRQLLEREPTAAELGAQSAALKNGDHSVRQIAERLVLGGEYERRFANGRSAHDLMLGLYRRVLARDADAAGLGVNEKRMGKAAFPTIATSFFENPEYTHRFGDWSAPGAQPLAYCAGK